MSTDLHKLLGECQSLLVRVRHLDLRQQENWSVVRRECEAVVAYVLFELNSGHLDEPEQSLADLLLVERALQELLDYCERTAMTEALVESVEPHLLPLPNPLEAVGGAYSKLVVLEEHPRRQLVIQAHPYVESVLAEARQYLTDAVQGLKSGEFSRGGTKQIAHEVVVELRGIAPLFPPPEVGF
jgi:hypothetical protein